MSNRISIQKLEPKSYEALFGVEAYLGKTSINPLLRELIKIRASQINGCAFCISMHTKQARKLGESEERIYALSAWRESNQFSETERAILALTDETTNLSHCGVSDETYENASTHLKENELAEVIVQIATINTWNRIAVATQIAGG